MNSASLKGASFFLKNRIRIESARVRGSNKDGRDVFLADGAAGIELGRLARREQFM